MELSDHQIRPLGFTTTSMVSSLRPPEPDSMIAVLSDNEMSAAAELAHRPHTILNNCCVSSSLLSSLRCHREALLHLGAIVRETIVEDYRSNRT